MYIYRKKETKRRVGVLENNQSKEKRQKVCHRIFTSFVQ
jgi:hypothetical protein